MKAVNIVSRFKDKIYDLLWTLLIASTCIYFALPFIGLEGLKTGYFLEMLLVILLFVFIKYSKRLIRVFAVAVSLITVIAAVFIIGPGNILKQILVLYHCVIGKESWNPSAGAALLIIVLLATVLACAIFQLTEKHFLARIIMLVALFVAIAFSIADGVAVSKAGSVSVLTLLLAIVIEIVEKTWTKEKTDKVLYIVFLWPVWIMLSVLVYITPVDAEPFRWTAVKDAINKIETNYKLICLHLQFIGSEGFSMGMDGYDDSGMVGGNLKYSTTVVLTLDAYKPITGNLYIAGVYSNKFNGNRWTMDQETFYKDWRFDTLETIYSVRNLDDKNYDDYLSNIDMSVRYHYFRSQYFFRPLKMNTLYWNNQIDFGEFKGSGWEKVKSLNDYYHTYFVQLNTEKDTLDYLIDNIKADDPELWQEVASTYRESGLSYEKLLEHREEVKRVYGEEFTLSPAVKDWLAQVTKGADRKIDRLRAVEKALSEMTYTLEPGNLPERVKSPNDFLEYLLETKEGYCTYYATAFALIARAEGFPTRFVQGFLVPTKGRMATNVLGKDAHAWPEVYFEGLGWIPFEPTPGFEDMLYTDWELYRNPALEDMHQEVPENPLEPDEDNIENLEDPDGIIGHIIADNSKHIIDYAIIAIIVLAFGLVIADILLGRRSYRRLDLKEKLAWEFNRNLRVLEGLGITKALDETLDELGLRVDEKAESLGLEKLSFIDEYQQVIYANNKASEAMVKAARDERKQLLTKAGRLVKLKEKYYNIRSGK